MLPKPATTLPVRVLVDVVSLEVFAAHGRGVCSGGISGEQIGRPAPVTIEAEVSDGAKPPTLTTGTVWGMGSIPAHVIG